MTNSQPYGTGPAAHAAGPRPPVLALSIQQPWAWTIAHAGKTPENRSWTHPHRGPIAIHASLTWDEDGEFSPLVQAAWSCTTAGTATLRKDAPGILLGAIIAVADLTGICTRLTGCDCGPWAARGQNHWQLTDVRALLAPIPARGQLGLWTMPDNVIATVAAALAAGEVAGRA